MPKVGDYNVANVAQGSALIGPNCLVTEKARQQENRHLFGERRHTRQFDAR